MDDNDKIVGVPLSNDHNAMQREEQEKLVKEHPGEHNVFRCRHPDSCYVKGALQPTRALGDFALKYSEFNGPPYVDGDRSAGRHVAAPYTPPYITAIPEVKSHKLEANDKFIIIGMYSHIRVLIDSFFNTHLYVYLIYTGSDGLWDYLSNQEAADIVNEQIQLGNQEQIGRVLIDRVLQKASARYGLSYSDLLTLPPGSQRRRRHDDTTVIVLFF
jgi:pyruvate dehydrogenase phosphatase